MLKSYISRFVTKYKKMSVVTKAALWFTFATVLQKGISFFTVPIFTRIMSTEQYGIFSVYLSWISVLTILGGMERRTGSFFNRFVVLNNIVLADCIFDSTYILEFGIRNSGKHRGTDVFRGVLYPGCEFVVNQTTI